MKKPRTIHFESLERRELMAANLADLFGPEDVPTYSIDGTGNNPLHDEWGSAGQTLIRVAAADYADGVSTPAGAERPSPREISNTLSDTGDEDVISDRDLSAFIYAWGQFIDHDISLTPGGDEPMGIEVPEGDPYFDPLATGAQVIWTSRSMYDSATGTSVDNPRQQVNTITAWLDGSMIYGSDASTASALRTFAGGKLKMTDDGMLPSNNAENFPEGTVPLVNDAHRVPDDELMAAGDERANENVELTSLHTLFVREHNRWADQLAAMNPELSDEQLYQRARMMVIAEIQSITYNEWLPAVLGRRALAPYDGYDAEVNPGLSNEFSGAAFRFGHSLLGDDVEFLDDDGEEVAEEIPLSEAFFNPAVLDEVTVDSIFKYLASDPSSEIDLLVVGSVRNFLFGPPGAGGLDLASLNIQRGRDHGLSDYNSVREAYGLERVESFAEITSDPEIQQKLDQLYGSVDNIDLWVGALAEDHLSGASVGETLSEIISEQFERLRDGDRFWYQSALSGGLLRDVERTRLSDILRWNTDMQNLQRNVFLFQASIGGQVMADVNQNGRADQGDRQLKGWTVELISATSGETIASTLTDARGRYRFDVQSGVRTGTYIARLTADDQGRPLDQVTRTVSITRGDQFIRDLDLAVPPRPAPPVGSGPDGQPGPDERRGPAGRLGPGGQPGADTQPDPDTRPRPDSQPDPNGEPGRARQATSAGQPSRGRPPLAAAAVTPPAAGRVPLSPAIESPRDRLIDPLENPRRRQ